jgi:hypothetical protein
MSSSERFTVMIDDDTGNRLCLADQLIRRFALGNLTGVEGVCVSATILSLFGPRAGDLSALLVIERARDFDRFIDMYRQDERINVAEPRSYDELLELFGDEATIGAIMTYPIPEEEGKHMIALLPKREGGRFQSECWITDAAKLRDPVYIGQKQHIAERFETCEICLVFLQGQESEKDQETIAA